MTGIRQKKAVRKKRKVWANSKKRKESDCGEKKPRELSMPIRNSMSTRKAAENKGSEKGSCSIARMMCRRNDIIMVGWLTDKVFSIECI